MDWRKDGRFSIEDAQRLIDESIMQGLASMRRQRQRKDHTSRLPSEVLCRIFSFAQRDDAGRMIRYSDWTRLTHVCRDWRGVSISSSSLWIEPMFGSPQWLVEAVKRSKNAGFVVNIEGPNPKHHLLGFRFAMEHSSRLIGLRILDNEKMDLWRRIRHATITKSDVQLELLELDVALILKPYPKTFADARKMGPFSTSQDVLNGFKWHLRSVKNEICRINWASPMIFQPALTHLTIGYIPDKNRPTEKQFTDAMKKLPNLEFLKLADASPVTPPTSLATIDRIPFPHLRNLIINSKVLAELETFFRLAAIPSDTEVKVYCFQDELSSTGLSAMLTALRGSYSTAPQFQLFTLYQSEDESDSDSTTLQPRFFQGLPKDRKSELKLQFDFTYLKQSSTASTTAKLILTNIFNGSIPLQDIQNVYLELPEKTQRQINPEMMMKIFGKLPKLFVFQAGSHTCKPFMDALELGIEILEKLPVDNPGDEVYFPLLCSVSLAETHIMEKSSDNPRAVSLELIEGCIGSRSICFGMQELRLIDCTGHSGRMEAMRGLVRDNFKRI